jgi:toluene monooxygenase electron transfer component
VKITVTTGNGSRVFECRPGEAILHAGLRSGVELPYECASGTCGSCKALLVEGRVESEWPDAPGRLACTDERALLTCQSVALEECTVAVRALKEDGRDLPRPTALDGVLRRARHLTRDVMALEVELERPLDFEAGQFALVGFPGVVGRRAYSMVSFEPAARRLAFVVRRKLGGSVSAWLFGDGIEGAPLTLFAPLGRAVFHPRMKKHLLCIAGGSGIAGIASILQRAAREGHFAAWDGHVFFGVRSAREAFYLDELQAVRSQFPARVTVTVALSEEDVPASMHAEHPGLRFARGLVHEVAGASMQGRFADVRAYVAGPRPMVDAGVRLLLREGRLAPTDIRYDRFN